MKYKKIIMIYLIGTMTQMGIVCSNVVALRVNGINYNEFIGLIFLATAGLSTAIWGCVASKLSGRIKRYREITKAFFKVREPLKYYAILFIFLMIIFGRQLLCSEILENVRWYTFAFAFFNAILFGGIEEIGWRYTYQPMLEKYMPYEVASICTFIAWTIWHYMYFYIVSAIDGMSHLPFILGLLASSFVLGAIYYITKSLWLCVLYHVMVNVFSQTLIAPSIVQVCITTCICIIVSIIFVRKKNKLSLTYETVNRIISK
ncbi:MAG: CPBP family intramembrane glutamic endopeptidase [Cellulosilyticaceae bacterium]